MFIATLLISPVSYFIPGPWLVPLSFGSDVCSNHCSRLTTALSLTERGCTDGCGVVQSVCRPQQVWVLLTTLCRCLIYLHLPSGCICCTQLPSKAGGWVEMVGVQSSEWGRIETGGNCCPPRTNSQVCIAPGGFSAPSGWIPPSWLSEAIVHRPEHECNLLGSGADALGLKEKSYLGNSAISVLAAGGACPAVSWQAPCPSIVPRMAA